MKLKNKFQTIILTCVLLLSCFSFNLSAETTGKITIASPNKGATYTIYKLLDLHSFDGEAYMYTIDTTSPWYTFLTSGEGKNYVTIEGYIIGTDEYKVVTWNTGNDQAEFAKAAKTYAVENSIDNQGSQTSEDGSNLVFSDLALGYYLVGSSAGALCSLDTTDYEVTIHEKNATPHVNKKVLTNNVADTSNNARIGDEVTFQATIVAQPGAENYVLHDTMSTGLTLLESPLVSVKVGNNDLAATNYSFERKSGQEFNLTLNNDYLKTIEETTEIVVQYQAMLNEKAVIGADGNTNTVTLKYGDNQESVSSSTTTYTYGFELVKTKADNTLLNGASFKLLSKGTELSFVYDEASNTYRLAKSGESGSTTINAGDVKIVGLSNGTYWLEETSAPAGYNPINVLVGVTINGENNYATIEEGAYVAGGVQVINRTGGALPVTGGTGTTILSIGAAALIIAGVSLLMFKKRNDK